MVTQVVGWLLKQEMVMIKLVNYCWHVNIIYCIKNTQFSPKIFYSTQGLQKCKVSPDLQASDKDQ